MNDITKIFGHWIDVSRIISVTDPLYIKHQNVIKFDVYVEMFNNPIHLQYHILGYSGICWVKNAGELFREPPESLKDYEYRLSNGVFEHSSTWKTLTFADSGQLGLPATDVIKYAFEKATDKNKLLRSLTTLSAFWRDYDNFINRWFQFKNKSQNQ